MQVQLLTHTCTQACAHTHTHTHTPLRYKHGESLAPRATAERCSLLDTTATPCFHRNGANRPSCFALLSLYMGQLYVQIEA